MTEQEQADALARQIDAMLAGELEPELAGGEFADLLELGRTLEAAAPTPRPAFGAALKTSLLQGGPGPAAPPASGALPFGSNIFWLLVGLAGLASLIAALVFSLSRPDSTGPLPAPTLPPAPTVEPTPLEAAPSAEPLAPSGETTPVNQATDLFTPPPPTATPILDILPPLTGTVEPTSQFSPPPDLVPGQPGSGGGSDDGDGGGRGGAGGGGGGDDDHDRGHGNDDDHHDDDNPGRGRD